MSDEKHFIGEILDYGKAPYQNKPGNDDSFYLTLGTATGEHMVWGKDLPRALEEAGVKVGDSVDAADLGKKDVTVKQRKYDENKKFLGFEEVPAKRTIWKITPAEMAIEVTIGATGLGQEKEGAEKEVGAGLGNAEDEAVIGKGNTPAMPPVAEAGRWVDAYDVRKFSDRTEYHHKEAKRLDLVDLGDRMSMRGSAGLNIGLELAREKGWTSIDMISGPGWMQSRVWVEANARGFKVNGYEPTEKDIELSAARRDKLLKEGYSLITQPSEKAGPEVAMEVPATPKSAEVKSKRSVADEKVRATRDSLLAEDRAARIKAFKATRESERLKMDQTQADLHKEMDDVELWHEMRRQNIVDLVIDEFGVVADSASKEQVLWAASTIEKAYGVELAAAELSRLNDIRVEKGQPEVASPYEQAMKQEQASPAEIGTPATPIAPAETRSPVASQEKQNAERSAPGDQSPTLPTLVEKGTHSGKVLYIDHDYLYQDAGRKEMVKHRLSALSDVPKVSDDIRVKYQRDGKAKVEPRQKEKQREALER